MAGARIGFCFLWNTAAIVAVCRHLRLAALAIAMPCEWSALSRKLHSTAPIIAGSKACMSACNDGERGALHQGLPFGDGGQLLGNDLDRAADLRGGVL
jgi:hypothetical protein